MQKALSKFLHPEEEEQMKSIGRVVKDRRIQKGLRISDINEQVGISKGQFARIERDATFDKPETLRRIADVLGFDDVTLEYLLDLQKEKLVPNENNIGKPIKRVRLSQNKPRSSQRPTVEKRTDIELVTTVEPKETASAKEGSALLDKKTVSSVVQALAEDENYEAIEKLMAFLKETSKQ